MSRREPLNPVGSGGAHDQLGQSSLSNDGRYVPAPPPIRRDDEVPAVTGEIRPPQETPYVPEFAPPKDKTARRRRSKSNAAPDGPVATKAPGGTVVTFPPKSPPSWEDPAATVTGRVPTHVADQLRKTGRAEPPPDDGSSSAAQGLPGQHQIPFNPLDQPTSELMLGAPGGKGRGGDPSGEATVGNHSAEAPGQSRRTRGLRRARFGFEPIAPADLPELFPKAAIESAVDRIDPNQQLFAAETAEVIPKQLAGHPAETEPLPEPTAENLSDDFDDPPAQAEAEIEPATADPSDDRPAPSLLDDAVATAQLPATTSSQQPETAAEPRADSVGTSDTDGGSESTVPEATESPAPAPDPGAHSLENRPTEPKPAGSPPEAESLPEAEPPPEVESPPEVEAPLDPKMELERKVEAAVKALRGEPEQAAEPKPIASAEVPASAATEVDSPPSPQQPPSPSLPAAETTSELPATAISADPAALSQAPSLASQPDTTGPTATEEPVPSRVEQGSPASQAAEPPSTERVPATDSPPRTPPTGPVPPPDQNASSGPAAGSDPIVSLDASGSAGEPDAFESAGELDALQAELSAAAGGSGRAKRREASEAKAKAAQAKIDAGAGSFSDLLRPSSGDPGPADSAGPTEQPSRQPTAANPVRRSSAGAKRHVVAAPPTAPPNAPPTAPGRAIEAPSAPAVARREVDGQQAKDPAEIFASETSVFPAIRTRRGEPLLGETESGDKGAWFTRSAELPMIRVEDEQQTELHAPRFRLARRIGLGLVFLVLTAAIVIIVFQPFADFSFLR